MPELLNGQRRIPILYEDDQCVVFNKPPGLLVVPADNHNTKTLTDILNQQYFSLKRDVDPAQKQFYLHPCHRLDKDTSGVILYAKGKRHQKIFMDVFKQNKVKKQYIAFVHGQLPQREGEIRSSIKDFYQKKFAGHSSAKAALTRYRVTSVHKQFSVLDVFPITGRTNQIRIHMVQIKNPIVGEDKYAFRKDFVLKFKRTALHAHALEWYQPLIKKYVRAQAPLPEDMQRFLSQN